jgi:DNA-binding LacI/PurR family transcriptional regulator
MSIVRVAKRAGVSIATVSRVINDFQNVRAETAQQVRAAMLEIGYTPTRSKRSPRSTLRRLNPPCFRTGRLAILTLGGFQHWLGLPVMASVVAGITRAAQGLEVRPVLDEMPDPALLSPVIRRREVDGAIVFVATEEGLSKLNQLRQHLPVVWVMGGDDGAVDVDHVSPDNLRIGHLAYEYLAAKGCDRLAFITDSAGWHIMRTRASAFANAALHEGRIVTSFVVGGGRSLEPYGRRVRSADTLEKLIDRFVELKPLPTGLFVPTDLLATKVYPMLTERGIRPQHDVQIVSCDNEVERLATLNPRPPSIDIGGEEIGRCAVRQLFQRLQRPDAAATRVQVAPSLVLPQSTAT